MFHFCFFFSSFSPSFFLPSLLHFISSFFPLPLPSLPSLSFPVSFLLPFLSSFLPFRCPPFTSASISSPRPSSIRQSVLSSFRPPLHHSLFPFPAFPITYHPILSFPSSFLPSLTSSLHSRLPLSSLLSHPVLALHPSVPLPSVPSPSLHPSSFHPPTKMQDVRTLDSARAISTLAASAVTVFVLLKWVSKERPRNVSSGRKANWEGEQWTSGR